MVYDPNERTRLRARQLQRLHAKSSSNPEGPLPFCGLLNDKVLTLASKLEPDPNRKLGNDEADWDPNWTKTQQSLSVTIRHFMSAAQRLDSSSDKTYRSPHSEPAPSSVIDDESSQGHNVRPEDKLRYLSNTRQTHAQDLEQQLQNHRAELEEKVTAITEMRRQVEKMQDLVTIADDKLAQSMIQFEIDMMEIKQELAQERMLRQALEAREIHLVEGKRVRRIGWTQNGRGRPAILNDGNKDILDNLIELMKMRARARAKDP